MFLPSNFCNDQFNSKSLNPNCSPNEPHVKNLKLNSQENAILEKKIKLLGGIIYLKNN